MPLAAHAQQKKPTATSKPAKTAPKGTINRHDIPKTVMSGFIRRFPNHVRDAQWKKEGANYVATFGEGDKKGNITLNAKGDLIKMRGPISNNNLPEDIQCYTPAELSDYRISSVIKNVTANETTTYEVLYKSQDKQKKIIFDRKGNPIAQ